MTSPVAGWNRQVRRKLERLLRAAQEGFELLAQVAEFAGFECALGPFEDGDGLAEGFEEDEWARSLEVAGRGLGIGRLHERLGVVLEFDEGLDDMAKAEGEEGLPGGAVASGGRAAEGFFELFEVPAPGLEALVVGIDGAVRPALGDRLVSKGAQFLHIRGFDEVGGDGEADGFGGGVDGRIAGEEDDGEAGGGLGERADHRQVAIAGHVDIGEQQVEGFGLQAFGGGVRVRSADAGVTSGPEQAGRAFTKEGVVVGQENAAHAGVGVGIG